MESPWPALQGLILPFAEFPFMRRALVASLALGIGSAPLGVFMVLRRMSLMGDAMAHALLPGAALGFMVAGFSLTAMSLGGFAAALLVAVLAGAVTRSTGQREDASFAAFYLIALALGVLMISSSGNSVDLMHVLFGSILAVDEPALLLIAGVSSVTLLLVALCFRPMVVESFDPGFLRAVKGGGAAMHTLLLVLTVANLVVGFQAMGTLMAVGLMMLPATAARFWAGQVVTMMAAAMLMAVVSALGGLLLSFHVRWPSGPAIVLVAGALYALSVFFGAREGLLWVWLRQRLHREA
ncbi:zinc/manganese transport system permease protein [Sphaerotilus hippei]|uniref:Zinc/manganese transport system permease protein n=1 Tax=Sphaerotilus hippei TaxID=744406 RepID=A0A318H4U6_9BURK|nr:metal ABC transporter permease [Sphaerotilus hippei]PXW98842.1 zinc/manganese transport system permease protein [Sphaerotilus hippei]